MFISNSWLELKPNQDKNGDSEDFDKYYDRIKLIVDYRHIPKEVFEQWIYPHHMESNTLQNYSWIDYRKVKIERCEWNYEVLSKLYVIDDFKYFYEGRGSFKSIDDFPCQYKDLVCWKSKGTWRVSPIVLDVESFVDIVPNWSELVEPFQLVEGHSRLGMLNSMNNISNTSNYSIAKKHYIYLVKYDDKGLK